MYQYIDVSLQKAKREYRLYDQNHFVRITITAYCISFLIISIVSQTNRDDR